MEYKNDYEKFKAKHGDKLKQVHICEICNNSYTYFTKHNHLKSKTHINCQNIVDKLKEFDKA